MMEASYLPAEKFTAMSYDGSIILAGSDDGTIWRWDAIASPSAELINIIQGIQPPQATLYTTSSEKLSLNGMVDCGSRHEHIKQRAMLLIPYDLSSRRSKWQNCEDRGNMLFGVITTNSKKLYFLPREPRATEREMEN